VRPRLSLGLEGGALGNEEYDAGRGGGFVRVNFRDFETTLSGGFTGNYLEDDPSFYLSLGLYRPFRNLRLDFAKVHCRPRSGSAWPRQVPTCTSIRWQDGIALFGRVHPV
jgi:hypothetical protein